MKVSVLGFGEGIRTVAAAVGLGRECCFFTTFEFTAGVAIALGTFSAGP